MKKMEKNCSPNFFAFGKFGLSSVCSVSLLTVHSLFTEPVNLLRIEIQNSIINGFSLNPNNLRMTAPITSSFTLENSLKNEIFIVQKLKWNWITTIKIVELIITLCKAYTYNLVAKCWLLLNRQDTCILFISFYLFFDV